jgi:NAD(P)-dependent dehydrogenase (short-subunit alcohol dehydrogenase family)
MTAAPTLISTPFGEFSTADEVAEGIDLGGRRAVVTGASSGIGVETARTLASHGAHVTMAVRDTAAGERVAADIRAGAPGAQLEVRPLELGDRASIAAFVDGWSGPLDLLVNNAGVMALPSLVLTAEGLEKQFATNHLGHFALATGLHRALAAADGARVVSVSSAAHVRCPVLFDDLSFSFVPYDPFLAYGQSKTANVLFAVEATRRWADDGITANAVMPGGISTSLQRHVDAEALIAARREAGAPEVMKTPEQGAATSVLLATSPLLDGVGGRYFEDCHEATVITNRAQSDGRHGVAPFALDVDNAARLWAVSEALLGR